MQPPVSDIRSAQIVPARSSAAFRSQRFLPLPDRGLRAVRGVLTMVLVCAALLSAGCSSRELDAVRDYKVFLEKAKPSLTAMNKARQDLYDLNDPEKMLGLFKDQLLPQVAQLKQIADAQVKPADKLGDIHETLKATLQHYDESTRLLVERLNSPSEDAREKAILAWGVDDQKFGKDMTGLVNDLSKYLDELKK